MGKEAAIHQAQQCALAASARSDHAKLLPLLHRQGHPAQGVDASKGDLNIGELEDGVHCLKGEPRTRNRLI
jgi:hypothetical protein